MNVKAGRNSSLPGRPPKLGPGDIWRDDGGENAGGDLGEPTGVGQGLCDSSE